MLLSCLFYFPPSVAGYFLPFFFLPFPFAVFCFTSARSRLSSGFFSFFLEAFFFDFSASSASFYSFFFFLSNFFASGSTSSVSFASYPPTLSPPNFSPRPVNLSSCTLPVGLHAYSRASNLGSTSGSFQGSYLFSTSIKFLGGHLNQ